MSLGDSLLFRVLGWSKFVLAHAKDRITPEDLKRRQKNIDTKVSEMFDELTENKKFLAHLFSLFKYDESLSPSDNVSLIITKLTELPDKESFEIVTFFSKLAAFDKDDELLNLKDDNSRLINNLTSLKKEYNSYKDKITKEINSIKKEHSNEIIESDKVIERVRNGLEAEKQKLSKEAGNRIIENDKLKKRIAELEFEVSQLKAVTSTTKVKVKTSTRRAHNATDPEKEKLVIEYSKAGKTNTVISELVGLSNSTVSRILVRNGMSKK